MIATFTSMESKHRMLRSVSFADTSAPAALTGGYHWRLDGKYSAVVRITNVGESRAAVAAFIHPNGGKDYDVGTRYIDPGETATFDLKQLRDLQVPDSKGVKLAKGAISGQFEWSAIHDDGSARLIGSAEVSNASLLVSSPDTVYHCSCPLSAVSAYISPGNLVVPVGGESSATTEVVYRNVCTGVQAPQSLATDIWQIDFPDILSVTSGQIPNRVKGLSAGTSAFTSTHPYSFHQWRFTPSNGCIGSWVQLKPRATGMVGPYQVQPIATASQFPAACPTGQAGWNRNVTNQVQYVNGVPYARSGLSVSDMISISSPNALGVSETESGTTTTTGDGSFPDNYSVCSPACPASSGEADAVQNWTISGIPLPHTNAVIYKCTSITIDGK